MNKKRRTKEPKKNKKRWTLKAKSNFKVLALLFLLALLFFLITIKLIYINVVQGEELTRKALNQLTRTETLSADRGVIYDRNKKELAVNVTRANIFYNMAAFDEKKYKSKADFNEDKKKTTKEDAKKIADVLEVDYKEILQLLKGKKQVKIASNVSREKALKIKELSILRVSVDDVTKRFYPYNNLAAHIIGFANDESTGVYGVESSYDRELSGMPGKSVSIKNNSHVQIPLTEEENYAPKEGYSTVLTLDENIQQFAEDAALKTREEHSAESVSIIVQDTKNGEILAMANNEAYDLNNPKDPVTEYQKENWDKLSQEEKTEEWFNNWRNFSINEQYEPGSTFKVITTAAALEEATTNLNKTYICNGVYTEIPGVKIGCTSQNRGPRTVEEALMESCNIALVKIGRELGTEKMYKYIKAFGFGTPTGIDLPAEANGQIPASADSIGTARLATMSYGHGIAVTPIQLINAVSAIANKGYLNTPRVVSRLEDSNGNIIEKKKSVPKRKVISDETSDTMKHLMGKVVSDGTGKRAQIPGYTVGGKTGTANIVSKKSGYENAYISSFVGVAPLKDPKITILVVVKRPKGTAYGSTVATPAAQEVLQKTLEYLKIPKTEKEQKSDKDNLVLVPNVKNRLLSDAGKLIVDSGIKFNAFSDDISNNAVVTKQSPSAGTYVEEGSIVDLHIDNNTKDKKTMPILVGKQEKEVESILKGFNLEYNIYGTGKVVSQYPEAGSKVSEDTLIKLTMESELNKENKDSDEEDNEDDETKLDSKNSKDSKDSKDKKDNKKEDKN